MNDKLSIGGRLMLTATLGALAIGIGSLVFAALYAHHKLHQAPAVPSPVISVRSV